MIKTIFILDKESISFKLSLFVQILFLPSSFRRIYAIQSHPIRWEL